MNSEMQTLRKNRPISTELSPLIYQRWSPRSMTGEALTDEEVTALFEAARLAPSAYNAQPWRFVYAKKGDAHWPDFFDLLVDFNKGWCKNAFMLVIFVSRKTFEHNNKPSATHSFDCGAAWMSMALEGARRNIVVHGMSGFDFDRAAKMLDLAENYQVEAMAAIGRRGAKELLPNELQEKETPSGRRPLSEIVFAGRFIGA